MERLDGNALAGELNDIFGVEMTVAVGSCASCGAARAVGEFHVYAGAGWVLRCPSCAGVVLAIVRSREGHRLQTVGLRSLEIPFS